MRVVIALDAFADDTQWRFLDQIVCKVVDGWHEWLIDDPTPIEETGWVEGKGRDWLRELFQKAALAAGYPRSSDFSKRRIVVSFHGQEPDVLPPKQAAEYVSTSLSILMENRFTDNIFLDTTLDLLAPDEMNEQRRTAPKSICYDSPGGNGELRKLVVDYAERARATGIPVRAVVFTDSDGTMPGEISIVASRTQQVCAQEGVPCMILRKRAIENYIPDEVLDAWISDPNHDKRRVVDAVKRLTPEQRDHYPMKKGLKIQGANPSIQAFYAGISTDDINELVRGFGPDVIERLRDYSSTISGAALRRRDGHGELDSLVQMIANEL